MQPETTAELLGRVPIFQGLMPTQLRAIAREGRDVNFEPGAIILQAGDTGNAAYLILDGFVAPDAHFEAWFADEMLGGGTFLGELAMLVETTFTMTVVARWNVRALAITRETMYALMEDDPGIAHHFAGKLVERLQQLAGDMRRVDSEFMAIENTCDDAVRMLS